MCNKRIEGQIEEAEVFHQINQLDYFLPCSQYFIAISVQLGVLSRIVILQRVSNMFLIYLKNDGRLTGTSSSFTSFSSIIRNQLSMISIVFGPLHRSCTLDTWLAGQTWYRRSRLHATVSPVCREHSVNVRVGDAFCYPESFFGYDEGGDKVDVELGVMKDINS